MRISEQLLTETMSQGFKVTHRPVQSIIPPVIDYLFEQRKMLHLTFKKDHTTAYRLLSNRWARETCIIMIHNSRREITLL